MVNMKRMLIGAGLGLLLGCASLDYAKNTKPKPYIEIQDARLGQGEFVVPDEVLFEFAKIVDPSTKYPVPQPQAGYMNDNYMTYWTKRKFQKRLKELGYSKEAIERYTNAFSKGHIVYSESGLVDDYLTHERYHREFDKLDKSKKTELCNVYDDLNKIKVPMNQQDIELYKSLSESGLNVLKARNFMKDFIEPGAGFYSRDCEEFWSYLATNSFKEHVINAIKNDYQKAHEIHLGILEKIKGEKND